MVEGGKEEEIRHDLKEFMKKNIYTVLMVFAMIFMDNQIYEIIFN
jgi:hypothetical protein